MSEAGPPSGGLAGFLGMRLLRAAITVAAALVLAFAGARISGNPFDYLYDDSLSIAQRAELAAEFGLDRSIPAQFVTYVSEIARGNFGRSIAERRPVVEMYADAIGPTLGLAAATVAVTLVIGLPLGIAAATRRRSVLGAAAMTIAFVGYAVPHFVLAIILILVFSLGLGLLPSIGQDGPLHYVLPTLTLSLGLAAAVVRFTRAELLAAMAQDHIRTALAKGVSPSGVVLRHALPSAMLPVITIVGLQVNGLINGSLIVETVFAMRGVGQLFIGAVQARDYPVLQFGVVAYALVVVAVNFAVDVCYGLLDPRIRRGG
jgi:glutathione transport system permease protein